MRVHVHETKTLLWPGFDAGGPKSGDTFRGPDGGKYRVETVTFHTDGPELHLEVLEPPPVSP